jgi:glutathione synthase
MTSTRRKIAILIAETENIVDGNYLRFGNELSARGHEVTYCLIDTLSLHQSRVSAKGFSAGQPLQDGDAFPLLENFPLEEFPDVWILSLGFRSSFLDKMQLLFSLNEKVNLINSLDTIMHLKSKYFLASKPELFNYPESYASSDPDILYKIVEGGGRWIAKPPAGSFGRDVFFLAQGDPNARVILQSLCGPELDQFTLLQKYVPEIEQGEKRVLLVAGKPVGQYRRLANQDHRTNIMQGAHSEACTLSDEEAAYCLKIGSYFKKFGAEFVGLDMAYPWIIECNVINPGGLLTIEELTGQDLTNVILDEFHFS